ncbi:diaminopropionate ammonia-lyase [Pelagibius sp. Alg239-R121]|uniref:diaminopropionate ammonia-lyase n=1 Tax=Pelagibius sp. Alg239-R121 TaxID=2993448 RepID=UPI0024A78EF2|nr:diaminopropionate ammonia-lyase [Pelagibius sp. Alg239-R121]
MLSNFETATVAHTKGPRLSGQAAESVINSKDFDAARVEITAWPGYAPTPLVELGNLAAKLSVGNVQYKHEGPRFGLGSFKALGGSYAAFRVLQRELSKAQGYTVPLAEISDEKFSDFASRTTVVSATDGNHGRALAWGAQRLGMPCRIYIHAEVAEERAEAIRSFGAEVIRVDGDYDASLAMTRAEAAANNWFIVSDTSWPGYTDTPRDVMAGYGVMVHEINQELECAPTHVFLQAGVGGLAAAVTAALRQHWGADSPRVIIVEPDLAPCLMASAKAGKLTVAPIFNETLMAGLSCGEPSQIAWEILAEEVSDFMTIPESLVAPAVRLMAKPIDGDPALEVGESAIAGLAGLICAATQSGLRDKVGLDESSRVLLIGSEGVTDRSSFNEMTAAA